MLIGELFGTPNHKVLKSISTSGKTMFIAFKKKFWEFYEIVNFSPTVELVASIKYNKIIPDCQSWLDGNVLISPNDPNINCSWIINRKFGSYITLDVIFIEVKPINIMAKKLILYPITIFENSFRVDLMP